MHITLVSLCKSSAQKRTRKILDSYAIRIATKVWQTPIRTEGLEELYAELRKQASKNTAIACYKNRGLQYMELLWIVGSKAIFGEQGVYSVFSTTKSPRKPEWGE